jgi:hypothetical protein
MAEIKVKLVKRANETDDFERVIHLIDAIKHEDYHSNNQGQILTGGNVYVKELITDDEYHNLQVQLAHNEDSKNFTRFDYIFDPNSSIDDTWDTIKMGVVDIFYKKNNFLEYEAISKTTKDGLNKVNQKLALLQENLRKTINLGSLVIGSGIDQNRTIYEVAIKFYFEYNVGTRYAINKFYVERISEDEVELLSPEDSRDLYNELNKITLNNQETKPQTKTDPGELEQSLVDKIFDLILEQMKRGGQDFFVGEAKTVYDQIVEIESKTNTKLDRTYSVECSINKVRYISLLQLQDQVYKITRQDGSHIFDCLLDFAGNISLVCPVCKKRIVDSGQIQIFKKDENSEAPYESGSWVSVSKYQELAKDYTCSLEQHLRPVYLNNCLKCHHYQPHKECNIVCHVKTCQDCGNSCCPSLLDKCSYDLCEHNILCQHCYNGDYVKRSKKEHFHSSCASFALDKAELVIKSDCFTCSLCKKEYSYAELYDNNKKKGDGPYCKFCGEVVYFDEDGVDNQHLYEIAKIHKSLLPFKDRKLVKIANESKYLIIFKVNNGNYYLFDKTSMYYTQPGNYEIESRVYNFNNDDDEDEDEDYEDNQPESRPNSNEIEEDEEDDGWDE